MSHAHRSHIAQYHLETPPLRIGVPVKKEEGSRSRMVKPCPSPPRPYSSSSYSWAQAIHPFPV